MKNNKQQKVKIINPLKKILLLLMLIVASELLVNAQSTITVGGHNLYKINSNYYEVIHGDTLLIDTLKVLVTFPKGSEVIGTQHLISSYNQTHVQDLSSAKVVMKLSGNSSYLTSLNQLSNDPFVLGMEPNHLLNASFYSHDNRMESPNEVNNILIGDYDPLWELQRIGMYTNDYCYDEGAWYHSVSDPGTIVAVVDDGLFFGDDDMGPDNGLGWDFFSSNGSNVVPIEGFFSHGTAVSSIIAARTSNNYGLCGVAGGYYNGENTAGTSIMMLRCGNAIYWDEFAAASCIKKAANPTTGTRIINLSWGFQNFESEAVNREIENAVNMGLIIFAASGNENSENISWPANRSDVIAVGATDYSDHRGKWLLVNGGWEGSNYGESLDISLPGEDIICRSQKFANTPFELKQLDGTSISCAMASGVAALMLSINPCLTAQEIKDILIKSCAKVGGYNYVNGHSPELGYGRVDAFTAVKMASGLIQETITINGIVQWNADRNILSDITIPSGSRLELNNMNLRMGKNTKITVEKGGSLSVVNTNITGDCSGINLWDGIHVLGDRNSTQIPNLQGRVYLNNATVQDAYVALFVPYQAGVNIAGGIVQAQNCIFKNCMQFYAFYNYPYESVSYFDNCTFVVDQNYLREFTTSDVFINLNYVKGVQFNGCSFINSKTGTPTGRAISAGNSSFIFKPSCASNQIDPCPEALKVPSVFNGFEYALYLLSGNAYFNLDKITFENNRKAIYASAVNNLNVVNCSVKVPEMAIGGPQTYGVYLNNCTGYHIENNSFFSQMPNSTGNIGLYVRNSGNQPNFVYRNTFYNLSRATVAEGDNRNSGGLSGLCYKCNDFATNGTDIDVLLPTGGTTTPTSGIALRQGLPLSAAPASTQKDSLAACNSFTVTTTSNIRNLSGNNSQYFHQHYNNTNYKIVPEPVINITRIQNDYTTYNRSLICKSWISNGGSPINQNLITSKNESKTQLSNAGLTLENKVDDGSTQNVTFDIAGSTPDKALELRNELLDVSPYLSDEALKTAIADDNALPNSMLRNVLVESANSESDEMMNMLTDKADPMPDYMIDQVAAGETVLGAREKMEAWYSALRQKDSWLLRQIVDAYLADSVTPDAREQLKTFLAAEHSAEASFILADLYMQDNDYAAAQTIFEDIQGNMEPDEYDNAQCNSYLSLCGILTDMLTDSLPLPDIDSLHAMQLYDLYLSNENIATAKARDLLVAAGWLNYEEPIANASELQSEEVKPDRKPVSTVTKLLVVYPNPASNYIIADYTLPEKIIGAKLIVSNTGGIVLQEIPLTLSRNQVTIPLQNLSSGNYILTLKTDKKVIESVYFSTLK